MPRSSVDGRAYNRPPHTDADWAQPGADESNTQCVGVGPRPKGQLLENKNPRTFSDPQPTNGANVHTHTYTHQTNTRPLGTRGPGLQYPTDCVCMHVGAPDGVPPVFQEQAHTWTNGSELAPAQHKGPSKKSSTGTGGHAVQTALAVFRPG